MSHGRHHHVDMPIRGTVRRTGAQRGRALLVRLGTELRIARVNAGLSLRVVAVAAGISHTFLWRIERSEAPRVDIDVLARVAASVGYELSLAIHPVGPPVRDRAHLALLARLRSRLGPSVRWMTEVPIPMAGDRRAADAVIEAQWGRALVEAETRIGDVQAMERRINAKASDMVLDRVILLVLDSRHNRDVIRATPELRHRFPVGTRAALAAISRGRDPGGDCLIAM